MHDDELLRSLRQAALEEERAFRAWADTPEGRRAAAPSPAIADAIVARAITQVAVAAARPAERRGLEGAPPRAATARRRAIPIAMAAAAMAAGAALFVRAPGGDPLPAYDVAIVAGAEQATRSSDEPARALVFRPGQAFEITLRPATRVAGALTARAAMVSLAGSTPLDVVVDAGGSGVVHVRGAWPAASAGPPPARLVLTVGRAGAKTPDPASAAEPASGAWRLVGVDVVAPR